MPNDDAPSFLVAREATPRTRQSVYPKPFDQITAGRLKRPLGDPFGLTHFGVNFTELEPGAASSLRHCHSHQDEFVFVLEGRPTLVTNRGECVLEPGSCVGFKAGDKNAHQLVNRSPSRVVVLEVGDRSAGDVAEYPDDDIAMERAPGELARDASGPRVRFVHKDGSPYG